MKFREMSHAAEFAEAYNGKQFNSMEVCHPVLPVEGARDSTRLVVVVHPMAQ